MKFKNLLTEELPSPRKVVPFVNTVKGTRNYKYTFEIGGHKYTAKFNTKMEPYWMFLFTKEAKGKEKEEKDYEGMRETRTGNIVPVFSTIIEIIKDFIKKKKPGEIVFGAEGRGRIKAYDLFIKKISVPGYKLEKTHEEREFKEAGYTLTRISK